MFEMLHIYEGISVILLRSHKHKTISDSVKSWY